MISLNSLNELCYVGMKIKNNPEERDSLIKEKLQTELKFIFYSAALEIVRKLDFSSVKDFDGKEIDKDICKYKLSKAYEKFKEVEKKLYDFVTKNESDVVESYLWDKRSEKYDNKENN